MLGGTTFKTVPAQRQVILFALCIMSSKRFAVGRRAKGSAKAVEEGGVQMGGALTLTDSQAQAMRDKGYNIPKVIRVAKVSTLTIPERQYVLSRLWWARDNLVDARAILQHHGTVDLKRHLKNAFRGGVNANDGLYPPGDIRRWEYEKIVLGDRRGLMKRFMDATWKIGEGVDTEGEVSDVLDLYCDDQMCQAIHTFHMSVLSLEQKVVEAKKVLKAAKSRLPRRPAQVAAAQAAVNEAQAAVDAAVENQRRAGMKKVVPGQAAPVGCVSAMGRASQEKMRQRDAMARELEKIHRADGYPDIPGEEQADEDLVGSDSDSDSGIDEEEEEKL